MAKTTPRKNFTNPPTGQPAPQGAPKGNTPTPAGSGSPAQPQAPTGQLAPQGVPQGNTPTPAGSSNPVQPQTPPSQDLPEPQEVTRDVNVAPISAGRIVAQGQATPENALETLIPVGAEAIALRDQAFAPRDGKTTVQLRGVLKTEFDMGVTEKRDILGVMLDAGTHTFSAAAAIVGAHLPGLEEHQVNPATAITPRVADPIETAQLDFDFRPEPIFADIVDATTFKIQLNNEEVTHA